MISISHRNHQDGKIDYMDDKGSFGGIIHLEYDYRTWQEKNPNNFPDYEDLVRFVLKELQISPDEVLIPMLVRAGDTYDKLMNSC